jgi:hypothetical protein
MRFYVSQTLNTIKAWAFMALQAADKLLLRAKAFFPFFGADIRECRQFNSDRGFDLFTGN